MGAPQRASGTLPPAAGGFHTSGILAASLGLPEAPPGDSTAFLEAASGTWSYAPPAGFRVDWLSGAGSVAWAVSSESHALFDGGSRTWGVRGALPTTAQVVGAWRLNGRSHLLTRATTTVTHWVLEDGRTQWDRAAPPEDLGNRFNAMSVAVGEVLYLIGGERDGAALRRVDVFSGY